MRSNLCFILIMIAVSAASTFGAVITFDDLYSVPKISDPQISPDSRQIAFVLKTTDVGSGESESHIWVMNSDGTNLRQMTNGESGESHPRWSPDGKQLAFHTDRGDGNQVWLLPLNGGEAKMTTSLSTGAYGMVWSPTGEEFIFASSVFPRCLSDSCNAARQKAVDDNPVKARLYDHLMFRHYKYWFDRKVDRILGYDLEDATTYQRTFTHMYAPIPATGGHEGYVFSPDGAEICYEANTDSIPALSTNGDLFVIPMAEGGPARITTGKGWDGSAQYSPDGRYIAYRSQARAGYESDQTELKLYNRKTGEHVNLTAEFDRSFGRYCWGSSSKIIYFLAIDHGFSFVYKIDITTQAIERILDDAVYSDLRVSPDGKYLVMTRSLSDQPYEMHRYDIRSKKLTRLTSFADEIVNRLDMNHAEEFWFDGFNGDSAHGFLTLPVDFDPNGKYPFVLLIHGGPQWCWLGDFNYYGWNTQLMAAQGYVVAQIDPHGSVGYGLKFKEYISGNWGRGDYEDL
ncbi:MAG: S9 family peptidase, partial [candidate division Zixibacteria bacterium]|nr:S9 family peptidase [candidate division Zixibacteria bacterium]